MKPSINRNEVFKLIAEVRLQTYSDEEVKSFLDDYDADQSGELNVDLYNTVIDIYKGVTNGYLSSVYEILTGCKLEVIGNVEELFPCPCCKFKTLTEEFDINLGTGYDICDHCNWEDDGTTSEVIKSSVNKGSISDYLKKIASNPNYYNGSKWEKLIKDIYERLD